MKPQTEELLYYLLWAAHLLARPTWRNLNDSFETWAWRNGLGRRLAALSREKLIERHPTPELRRVVRLTELGREIALGGRDPAQRWERAWDGVWRLVMFDIPVDRGALRRQLIRLLHRHHFGCLQKSVWVTPDSTAQVHNLLRKVRVEADAFLVVEGRPAAGESDAEIVAGAWDFPGINRAYEKYLDFLRRPLPVEAKLVEWARTEQAVWKTAVQSDPLLPAPLLPGNYRGREAYRRRQELSVRLAPRLIAPATP